MDSQFASGLRREAPSRDGRWEQLLEALVAARDEVHDQYAARALAELPTYANLTLDEHRAVADRNVTFLLERLREARPPLPDEDETVYREAGEARAHQGVVIGDLLQAWSIFLEVVCDRGRTILDGSDEALLLRFTELVMAWVHFGMRTIAQGHQAAQATLVREAHQNLTTLVRGIVFGEMAPADVHEAATAHSIDLLAPHHAVRAKLAGVPQLAVERYLNSDETPSRRNAILALIDDDLCGIVRQLPSRPAPVLIGVSTPATLREMEPAFRQATRVLEAADAFGRHGLQTLESLGVLPAILDDDEVGEAMIRRYVAPLERLGRGRDTLLETVEALFASQSRLESTARRLHVHVNTVKYRIARFEELTDCSLRDPDVLLQAWWAVRRTRLR